MHDDPKDNGAQEALQRAKQGKSKELGSGPSGDLRAEILYEGDKVVSQLKSRKALIITLKENISYYLKMGCCMSKKSHVR